MGGKTVAVVQARLGSSRLRAKVIRRIGGVPMIDLLLSRLAMSKHVDQIVVAVPFGDSELPLVHHVRDSGYQCVIGSENDVLQRYIDAATAVSADVLVRITGDCPLVDPALVDQIIDEFKRQAVDYYSNVCPATFPDGLDVEVFTLDALRRAALESADEFDREHVTPYLRKPGLFKQGVLINDEDLSSLRWTVDESADLDVISNVFKHFAPDIHFSWKDVLKLQTSQPALFAANCLIRRNEGALMGAGQKLWKRAKVVIPGGNMLLSKRAEMFLPEQWPSYFSRAKGCKVWDMDGHQYVDMSIMGIGTNILGYGHDEVDRVVNQAVNAGNMSTFNCPEEVYLVENLLRIHPWADMGRLARSGGEANAIAIRIARAASGRDKVAVCGYHGWHDWYLSANLGDEDSLASHLLPALEPKGVPRQLRGTVFPFKYNNYQQLEDLVKTHDIGVIKMEVERNIRPEDNFLHKVRQLASQSGIVLIFDECTSGFRETFGGLHKKYGVEPDMAMFGKALGNGYSITATIGRREVMEAAQSTFISSTFWTERIGPTAALKTLEIMELVKSWENITQTGFDIRERWQKLADLHELSIDLWGLPALSGFTFKSENALAYKTLITQEMLRKGYLAGNSIYVCTEHTPAVVDAYFEALDSVFSIIKQCEDGRDVMSLLKGPVCHSGFKRLN